MVEQESLSTSFNLGLGIAVSFSLAVVVIIFTIFYQRKLFSKRLQMEHLRQEHQAKLLATMVEAQENERRRIAIELHDDVGATLSTAKLYLAQQTTSHSGDAVDNIEMVDTLLDHVISSVRSITRDLLPADLERFGLGVAINTLCQLIDKSGHLSVEFDKSGLRRYPVMVELHLYRILQELLNNAIKHADANCVRIDLHQEQDRLLMKYRDDGKGLLVSNVGNTTSDTGLGLKTIAGRAELLSGQLDYKSSPGQGVSVTLTLPV